MNGVSTASLNAKTIIKTIADYGNSTPSTADINNVINVLHEVANTAEALSDIADNHLLHVTSNADNAELVFTKIYNASNAVYNALDPTIHSANVANAHAHITSAIASTDELATTLSAVVNEASHILPTGFELATMMVAAIAPITHITNKLSIIIIRVHTVQLEEAARRQAENDNIINIVNTIIQILFSATGILIGFIIASLYALYKFYFTPDQILKRIEDIKKVIDEFLRGRRGPGEGTGSGNSPGSDNQPSGDDINRKLEVVVAIIAAFNIIVVISIMIPVVCGLV